MAQCNDAHHAHRIAATRLAVWAFLPIRLQRNKLAAF
jgi:hypothetical protein